MGPVGVCAGNTIPPTCARMVVAHTLTECGRVVARGTRRLMGRCPGTGSAGGAFGTSHCRPNVACLDKAAPRNADRARRLPAICAKVLCPGWEPGTSRVGSAREHPAVEWQGNRLPRVSRSSQSRSWTGGFGRDATASVRGWAMTEVSVMVRTWGGCPRGRWNREARCAASAARPARPSPVGGRRRGTVRPVGRWPGAVPVSSARRRLAERSGVRVGGEHRNPPHAMACTGFRCLNRRHSAEDFSFACLDCWVTEPRRTCS